MNGAAVSDLSPLQGMPLTRLTCDSTLVRDLSPLKGLPLRSLSIQNVPAKDFTPLRSLASLIKINGLPAVEFWKQVDAGKASATDDMAWKDAINLLSLVELPKGVRYGKWERRNNTIAVQVDKAYAQLAFPYRPPAEYDYRVTFVCSQGQGIVLILYREGHQLTFQLGIHGMTGFEVIDGAHVAEAPGTIKRKQMVSLDSTLIECTTDYRDVHSHEDWKLPENTPVGIGTTGSTVEFLAAEIREVTGKGSFMRGAPAQPGSSPAVKQEIKSLFNGRNLTGWRARDTNKKNEWSVRSGTLICTKPGPDLLTEEQFMDFLFHCEFKLSPAANSGVYLRGRYEIQLQDDHGKPVTEQSSGGLYKVIAPSVNAIKPAGVWQTLDAAVAGQRVQIILNGKKVIENGLLSKPTVGALDQNIDQAGPLLLQGFMGQVEFRNLLLMPLNPGVNLQTLTFPAGWPNPRRN
ncbi:MAG: DUF1080 domain-containing protein [Kiritimatiellaeota bacterium]|nr:DUF1080 domain-containing protein [Kiritimatiellota bacterium]